MDEPALTPEQLAGALRDQLAAAEQRAADLAAELDQLKEERSRPQRRRLPVVRPSITHRFDVGGHVGYLTVGMYPDTHRAGEIFVEMGKEGSTISGLIDAWATAFSYALQYGVPLEDLARKFSNCRFEPSGFTGNGEIPFAKSIIDYISRWLAFCFGVDLGQPPTGATEGEQLPLPIGASQPTNQPLASGPPCPDCGALTVPTGHCHCCPSCGTTTGCS